MNWLEIAEYSSALLTPAIAVVTVVILVQQFKLARMRWRLDLYGKRYPIYAATARHIARVVTQASITSEEIVEFRRNILDYTFLFGKEIRSYLDCLYKKSEQLRASIHRLDGYAVGSDERNREIETQIELSEWFSVQSDKAKDLFSAYLSVDKK